MNNELMSLEDFIKLITHDTRVHICVHDLSGMLLIDGMELDYINTIHYNEVCNWAKTTRRGFRLCLKCKELANKKAISQRQPFWGICPWGVTEYVLPVIVNSEVICIIYVGNICVDSKSTQKHMRHTSKITGVDSAIADKIAVMAEGGESELYKSIGEAVKSYILLLYATSEKKKTKVMHWAVRAFLSYADAFYNKEITVADIAGLYGINKKYSGRLFKKEVGISFCEYLNLRRTEAAKGLLGETDMSIAEIALECGYNNITYFNRVFKKITGISPGEYRKSLTLT